MKKAIFVFMITGVFAVSGVAVAGDQDCQKEKYHKGYGHGKGLSEYKVRFNDLDKDGDGGLNWDEYNAHFTDAKKDVFDALDTGKDGAVSREEWHAFKSAHGMAEPMGQGRFHKADLPDPTPYNAHFPDIDADGDDAVSLDEFKAYFPEGEDAAFAAIDLDKNKSLSHDEWHAFKSAHGMGHGHGAPEKNN